MPRVTVAHEQEVKRRIVRGALQVFAEKGFHRATIQDVVRETGLSVGAIYTYFKTKEELFYQSCDLSSEEGFVAYAELLAGDRPVVEKVAIAIRLFLDEIDRLGEAPGFGRLLVQAWAEAADEPPVRAMLTRRREQLASLGRLIVGEGIARGEFPAWVDVEGLAYSLPALLDEVMLQRVEQGDDYRRAVAERRLRSIVELLFSAATGEHVVLPEVPPASR
jgi:AcrR family transcriptional regulator